MIANRGEDYILKRPGAARPELADLQTYLQGKIIRFAPGLEKVIAEINNFTSAILQSGLQAALASLGVDIRAAGRPFIEVCDAIVEYNIRVLNDTDRELVGKSLFEAYMYAAGSEHAFEPASRTQLVQSLRRRRTKGFAALFLSLHLFNTISLEIQGDVRESLKDLKSFEIYMLGIEAICREIVEDAMKIADGNLDEQWAGVVCKKIEARLLSGY